MAMDEMLLEAGVDLWLDTLACLPVCDGRRIEAVEVENKSGRIRIEASFLIDATGDADIAARAGAPFCERRQRPCMLTVCADAEHLPKAVETGEPSKALRPRAFGDNEWDEGYEGDCEALFGGSGRDVSRFMIESRQYALRAIAAKQRELGEEGRKKFYPVLTASLPDLRRTRTIDGLETMSADMRNKRVESSVGMVVDPRQKDAVWEVPYGSIVPRGIENLYVVGRCSAAEDYAWQVSRLIPGVILTGQVAGAAAALCIGKQTAAPAIDVRDVQSRLESLGIELHV